MLHYPKADETRLILLYSADRVLQVARILLPESLNVKIISVMQNNA